MRPKPNAESRTVMTEIVLPSDSNALGTAFGGKVMQWIDICAAIAAQRHCRMQVVTAAIDELHFRAPIRVGMICCLAARVNATFSKSLEVGVEVQSEDPLSGQRLACCSALLTFAAIDEERRPTAVPPLLLETPEDERLQREAEARRRRRLENRAAEPHGHSV